MDDPKGRLFEQLVVLRSQIGDPSAFTELVERYDRRLRYFALKMGIEPGELDDLLQDAWCDIYRGLPGLKDAGAFSAWAHRIVRDRVLRIRRRTPHMHQAIDEIELPEDEGSEPDFTAGDAAQIHTAMDQLSEEHREVLVLRFVEEMTYEQIADVVQCPLGTVRSRIYQAKVRLRHLLERMNSHEPR